jgi:hypothetical protein
MIFSMVKLAALARGKALKLDSQSATMASALSPPAVPIGITTDAQEAHGSTLRFCARVGSYSA